MKTFSGDTEPQAIHPIFLSPHLGIFATHQLDTSEGPGLETYQPSKGLLSSWTPMSNPHLQIDTTTSSPAVPQPCFPGSYINTKDAGAERSSWFFHQFTEMWVHKMPLKRHSAQVKFNRNRRATEITLACSIDRIHCKCLRWKHSSTSLFNSPIFFPAINHMVIRQANGSLISCRS